MIRALLAAIAASFVVAIAGAPAAAADRVALVIGNGAYTFAGRLTNPANDATDMAKALREIGFDVVDGTDLDRRAMEAQVSREFFRKLGDARVALFFYAGHGMQVGGKNYLIPVDAKLEQAGDLALDTIEVSVVLQQMEVRERVNLVFLDACRDNPLSRSFARSLGASRVGRHRPGPRLDPECGWNHDHAFATQPDAVALDSTGHNSPFTTALLKRIRAPGVDVSVMMRQVRNDVLAATGRRQVPWDHSSLTDAVFLVQDAGKPPPSAAAPPAAPSPAAQPLTTEAAQAWGATKDTTSAGVLEAFIKRFGSTVYGDMARARLAELRANTNAKPAGRVASVAPSAPAVASDKTTPDAATPCRKVIGVWSWFIGGDVTVRNGGTAAQGPRTATWTCSNAQIVMVWSHGFTDRLTISADGTQMTGTNQIGIGVSATRKAGL